MSEIFSEAELRELASIGTAGRTNLKRLITSHRQLQAEMDALKAELAEKDRLYHELLYQVGNKYPNESRHETALRYLKRAEQPSNDPAKQAKP